MIYIGATRKSILIGIFQITLLLQLIFLLLPSWSGSPLWNIITHEQYISFIVQGSSFIFLFSSILFVFLGNSFNRKLFSLLLVIDFIFILSLLITGFQSGLLAVVGIPLSYICLFDIIKRYSCSHRLLFLSLYVMLIWCVLPILYLPFIPSSEKVLFFTAEDGSLTTFTGFALHRNFYGMVIGLVFILLLKLKLNMLFKFVSFVILLIGLFICSSRSAIVSVIVVLSIDYILIKKTMLFKHLPVIIWGSAVLFTAYYFYSQYSLRATNDNDARNELYQGFFSMISKHPIWGYGYPVKYYSIRPNFVTGSPAHNFIVQLWADYGLIVLFSFLFLLAFVYKKMGRYSRMFLVYVIVWGLFQPYFGFGIPSSQVTVPILLGYLMDNDTLK